MMFSKLLVAETDGCDIVHAVVIYSISVTRSRSPAIEKWMRSTLRNEAVCSSPFDGHSTVAILVMLQTSVSAPCVISSNSSKISSESGPCQPSPPLSFWVQWGSLVLVLT